jgi:hypothetical protein
MPSARFAAATRSLRVPPKPRAQRAPAPTTRSEDSAAFIAAEKVAHAVQLAALSLAVVRHFSAASTAQRRRLSQAEERRGQASARRQQPSIAAADRFSSSRAPEDAGSLGAASLTTPLLVAAVAGGVASAALR